ASPNRCRKTFFTADSLCDSRTPEPWAIGKLQSMSKPSELQLHYRPAFSYLSSSTAGCRRLMCWNSACRDLRRFESTESGSEVNRLIEGVCGKRLPTVNFPHVDLS